MERSAAMGMARLTVLWVYRPDGVTTVTRGIFRLGLVHMSLLRLTLIALHLNNSTQQTNYSQKSQLSKKQEH